FMGAPYATDGCRVLEGGRWPRSRVLSTLPRRGRVGARSAPGWGENFASGNAPMARVLQLASRRFVGAKQRRVNRFHHASDVVRDVIAPEAKDAIPLAFKPSCSLLVTNLSIIFAVLRSVHFNDKMGRRAGEIDDKVSDRHLSTEMRARISRRLKY